MISHIKQSSAEQQLKRSSSSGLLHTAADSLFKSSLGNYNAEKGIKCNIEERSLNAYFSFVEPASSAPTNKQGNGEKDESSQRSTEQHHKQSLQKAKAEENGSQQRPAANVITPTTKQVPASTQAAKNNIKQGENVPIKKGQSVQTGIDRYINIKRKLSPSKSAVNPKKFQGGTPIKNKPEVLNGNRFALLSNGSDDDAKGTTTVVNAKPPPIYLRERSSNALVAELSKIVGNNNFHIVPLKKGNIDETKIQSYTEKSFMDIVKFLSNKNENYYSYQLKSSKGLVVVIKGIEPAVDSSEVKEALEECGFGIKTVVNIFNRNKVPQPMFKI
ncbi:uncharacterized protein LOC126759320 [Bactrocera neohumeralis]|uniref:uncharacterized protein LOC126759320 n=1 Tax=Bactrocera neohumeralis TaxID=98809 RepID=UPI002165228D|nr:uncharacterized protein LOC126759320 [Bactrocera neohumeralis]